MKRSTFIKQAGALAGGITILNFPVFGKLAPSNKVVLAVAGVNSRGNYLAEIFQQNPQVQIAYLCDVEDEAIKRGLEKCKQAPKAPTVIRDIRELVTKKDFDALIVATPDHWQTTAAALAAMNGKHVYVEKPGSHDCHEAMVLAALPKKYKTLIQLGNQRRSMPSLQQAVAEVKAGIIGRTYYGKAWYSNSRLPIGKGKKIPVPATLNWDLWQGPAPRRELLDNIVHYNWHWRWHWGTGEACNNGTHEIDCCRWFMDLEYPESVVSTGGRLAGDDDWEAPDTQLASFHFPGNKMISWEGRSTKTWEVEPSSRGFTIFGENGTLVNLGGGDYKILDPKGKIIKEIIPGGPSDASNTVSSTGNLDLYHVNNFVDAVAGKAKLSSPVEEACKSILLCHLSNIAVRSGQPVKTDPATGRIISPGLEQLWKREYAPGWEKYLS